MTCKQPGCESPKYCLGFCQLHYQRQRDGRDMEMPKWGRIHGVICSVEECNETTTARGYCLFHYNALYYFPGKRERHLKRRYNLSLDEYAAKLEGQGGVCAICSKEPGSRSHAVDHDHSCCSGDESCGLCVRGLLCYSCNSRLSTLEDVEWRIKADAYIVNWSRDLSHAT